MVFLKKHYLSILIVLFSVILAILRSVEVANWDWITILIVFVAVVGAVLSFTASVKNKNTVVKLSEKVVSFGMEVVDNPEWIYVIVDAEYKILFGIHTDGSIEWGVGVPKPIREELEKLEVRIQKLEKLKKNSRTV